MPFPPGLKIRLSFQANIHVPIPPPGKNQRIPIPPPTTPQDNSPILHGETFRFRRPKNSDKLGRNTIKILHNLIKSRVYIFKVTQIVTFFHNPI